MSHVPKPGAHVVDQRSPRRLVFTGLTTITGGVCRQFDSTRFGVIHSEASGVDVPAGYTITYTLSDGEQFIFNLTETTEVLDLPVYHRSIGPVTGGKVGETPSEGVVMFEWLNPGVNVYTPPSS